jgi:hypothetical protein
MYTLGKAGFDGRVTDRSYHVDFIPVLLPPPRRVCFIGQLGAGLSPGAAQTYLSDLLVTFQRQDQAGSVSLPDRFKRQTAR